MSSIGNDEVFTTWTSETQHADISVVFMCGELDASSAPEFLLDMQQVIKQRKHVIMDVHLLEYVDSTGVGAILSTKNALGEAGMRLCMIGCHGLLTKILLITQIDRELRCFEDIDSAVAAVRADSVIKPSPETKA